MEKVGVITFHRADNYGAVLQTYATQYYLKHQGIAVDIIDYKSPGVEESYKLFDVKKGRNWIHCIKICFHDITRIPRKLKFNRFRKKCLNCSNSYTVDSISESNKYYDAFITGSDQVWNDRFSKKDDTYCLTFVQKGKKKISYAASFGVDFIDDDRKDFYKRELKSFTNISVREKSGVEIVKELIGVDATLLSDPTLMLTKNDWNEIAKKPKRSKYILVYLMNARKEILQFAENLSKKTGLEVLNITDDNRSVIKAKGIHNAGPKEFLGYFNNAEYVITNSFHGLMFSIIYRKSMYVDIPQGKQTTYERLTNILDELEIDDRYISQLPLDFVPQKLDYSRIEEKIVVLQNETDKFFRKNFTGDYK